jgi:phosphatidylinositol 4-kinase
MLLQRLRGADSPTESSIVTNLVSLGLRAPESALSEVIAAFSAISRSSHPEDPRFSSNSVLAAQTSLAKGFLDSSLNASRSFLEELLSLFIDKGAQIQTQSMSRHVKESEKEVTCRSAELTSQLAAMLLPIDALLANPACQVEDVPNQELLSSFRNMWLLCTLLGLTNPTSPHMTEATTHALTRIAAKTPALVLEAERDFVSSVLEYNSIFRRDYAVAVCYEI